MKNYIISLILFFSQLAYAQTCDPANAASMAQCLQQTSQIGAPPTCATCPGVNPSACTDAYNRMYEDGTVNVMIAWGYGDSSGTTNDNVWSEYFSNLLVEKLTGPCPTFYSLTPATARKGTVSEIEAVINDRESTGCGQMTTFEQSCGFKRGDDAEILEKDIIRNGQVVKIRIRALRSPHGESDAQNRATMTAFLSNRICQASPPEEMETCVKKSTPPKISSSVLSQKCQKGDEQLYQVCRSDYVRKAWRQSIESGDEIVMYNGHARDGGGPSFDPPKVTADGHVDYNWYRTVREGHKQETDSFKKAVASGKPPVFYASTSCNSKRHFITNGNFPEVSPSTSIVASNRTVFTDEGFATTLATLNGAFSSACDLNARIQKAGCGYGINNF